MPSLFQRIQPDTPSPEQIDEALMGIEGDASSDRKPLIAKTMQGLEGVLAAELEALGATDINLSKRAVEFRGDTRLMYRACYELRTALRVLVRIHSCKIYNEKNLYHAIRDDIDWTTYMKVTDTLAVDSTVAGRVMKHGMYTNLVAKDAIVDQFREKMGSRPNVDPDAPTLRIHVRINDNFCDILLDPCGDSLHKRGYRRDAVAAPLNEVLAAGMILLSGWDCQKPFVDAMCGSGTLPIEACMLALRIPPQKYRDIPFGFLRWNNFDAALWADVRQKADAVILKELPFRISAFDKDARARNATALNAMSAGLDKHIDIEKIAFERLEPPIGGGLLMLNPPYDERLPVPEVVEFYQEIANRLKHHWAGWEAWVLSGHIEALKHFGLRPSRKIELLNGAIQCEFKKFDLFAGKKGHEGRTPDEEGS
jgi:putative N6-adenine-specific DNA methylase